MAGRLDRRDDPAPGGHHPGTVAALSRLVTLQPGDPILTSTPAGILGASILLALRVPVAVALGVAGTAGYLAIARPSAVIHVRGSWLLQVGTKYTLSVVPLFVLMGAVAMRAGMSRRLFSAATALFGRVRGAESMATIVAAGAFGAVSGSSLATTATMTRVAGPELKTHGTPTRPSAARWRRAVRWGS